MCSAMRQSEGGLFLKTHACSGEKVRGMDLSPGEQTLVSLRDLTFGASRVGGRAGLQWFLQKFSRKIHVVDMWVLSRASLKVASALFAYFMAYHGD